MSKNIKLMKPRNHLKIKNIDSNQSNVSSTTATSTASITPFSCTTSPSLSSVIYRTSQAITPFSPDNIGNSNPYSNLDNIINISAIDLNNNNNNNSNKNLGLPSLHLSPKLGCYNNNNTNSNYSLHSNYSNHSNHSNHSTTSSSNTIQLNMSETQLTPNLTATVPNLLIKNNINNNDIDNFSLDTFHTSKSNNINIDVADVSAVNNNKNDIKHQINYTNYCNTLNQTNNIIIININDMDHESKEDEKCRDLDDDINFTYDNDNDTDTDDDDDDENILCDIINGVIIDDNICESVLLSQRGYKKGKKLAKTLQGSIYEIISIKTSMKYVMKITDKSLHNAGITIQNGKKYVVQEDILNEYNILKIITQQSANGPHFLCKYIDFFENNDNYYLIMEHGGCDLFEFVLKAHQYIQNGSLNIKEWRKFVKYIFWQMVVLLLWLHNTVGACHLDISLENLLVQNAKFIDIGNGQKTISTNIQIKFCDFGLAQFYDIDVNDTIHSRNKAFLSDKYCGKTNYKSPQVHSKKGKFDARKADVWSLGVVLFCMAVGAPPYKKPISSDECFTSFIKKGHIAQLLYQWGRHNMITERMLSLLKTMLKYNENKRATMDDIVKHPWLRTYYQRYSKLVTDDLLETIMYKH